MIERLVGSDLQEHHHQQHHTDAAADAEDVIIAQELLNQKQRAIINEGMSAVIEEDSIEPNTMLHSSNLKHVTQHTNQKSAGGGKAQDSDMMEVLMRQIVESNDNLENEMDEILSSSKVHNSGGQNDTFGGGH